jgi:hypothetical protein
MLVDGGMGAGGSFTSKALHVKGTGIVYITNFHSSETTSQLTWYPRMPHYTESKWLPLGFSQPDFYRKVLDCLSRETVHFSSLMVFLLFDSGFPKSNLIGSLFRHPVSP